MNQQELKPEDLRIGNIVAFEGNDIPQKINEISVLGEMCFVDDINLEWVFGVSLSEEILSRIKGVEKVHSRFELSYGYTIKKDGDSYNFCVGYFSDFITLCEIKYLHQFQNIYHALTGEELTLNSQL